jgi:hypothetical protein
MPASTEQILHPTPTSRPTSRSACGSARASAPDGVAWRAGTWGELQTRELLALAGSNAREAAAGWGGDRYELWESRGKDVLVMRWRWDTRRDKAEFAAALREWAQTVLKGPHTVVERGGAVTLVVAPDARILAKVAAGA